MIDKVKRFTIIENIDLMTAPLPSLAIYGPAMNHRSLRNLIVEWHYTLLNTAG